LIARTTPQQEKGKEPPAEKKKPDQKDRDHGYFPPIAERKDKNDGKEYPKVNDPCTVNKCLKVCGNKCPGSK
jgi:hypothetical protein